MRSPVVIYALPFAINAHGTWNTNKAGTAYRRESCAPCGECEGGMVIVGKHTAHAGPAECPTCKPCGDCVECRVAKDDDTWQAGLQIEYERGKEVGAKAEREACSVGKLAIESVRSRQRLDEVLRDGYRVYKSRYDEKLEAAKQDDFDAFAAAIRAGVTP